MPWVCLSVSVCPSFSLHASPPLVVTVNSGILYIWCVSMDHIHHSFWRSVVPVLANGSLFISWHLCSLAWLLTFWRNKVSQGSLCKVLLWPWDQPLCKDPCAIWWRRFHKRRDHCCWLSLFTGLFGGYPKKKKKKEEGKHEFKQIFLNQILHYKIFFLNFDFMSVSHFFHFESWFPTTLS